MLFLLSSFSIRQNRNLKHYLYRDHFNYWRTFSFYALFFFVSSLSVCPFSLSNVHTHMLYFVSVFPALPTPSIFRLLYPRLLPKHD
jgi:hypothetical protein